MDITEQRFARIEMLQAKQQELLTETTETLKVLADALARHAEASNARLTRIEENLHILIRAIITEHSNGKGKQLNG